MRTFDKKDNYKPSHLGSTTLGPKIQVILVYWKVSFFNFDQLYIKISNIYLVSLDCMSFL